MLCYFDFTYFMFRKCKKKSMQSFLTNFFVNNNNNDIHIEQLHKNETKKPFYNKINID